MEQRSYTYVLKGEPEALVSKRSDDIPGWNTHKETRLITTITLESQHEDRPLLYGPIYLDAAFYFHTPSSRRAHVKANDGDWYLKRPSLFFLLHFLEQSAVGIIWADTALIARSSGIKLYGPEAKTVFTVTEMQHESKSRKKVKE